MYRVQGLGTQIGLKFETPMRMDYLAFNWIIMYLWETRIALFSTFMYPWLVFFLFM